MLHVKSTNIMSCNLGVGGCGWVCGLVFMVMIVRLCEAIRVIRMGETLSVIVLIKRKKVGVPVFGVPVL